MKITLSLLALCFGLGSCAGGESVNPSPSVAPTPTAAQTSSQPSPTAAQTPVPSPPDAGENYSVTLPECNDCLTEAIPVQVGNTARTFHLYLPAAKATTVVTILHGNGGSADQIIGRTTTASPLKVWLAVAKRENLVLVIPNGIPGSEERLGWNDCRADGVGNPSSDDVKFLTALARTLNMRLGVSKHLATGMSNGGHMAIRLAAEAPEVFSGVAAVSAAVAANSECTPKNKPVSVLLMNGTADPIAPYSGGTMAGNRGKVLSMSESLKVFLGWNGIVSDGTSSKLPDTGTDDNSTVTRNSYPASAFGTRVEGYTVNGGGHTEPSMTEFYSSFFKLVVGEQNRDIECAEMVWDFFSKL